MTDDTSVAPFKSWLRNRQKHARRDAVDELGKRLIEDTRIPSQGSLGLYRAHLRSKGYSQEDIDVFGTAWQEMRDQEAKDAKVKAYNAEMDARNHIIAESIDKPWLPLHDGE